jgi:lysozyme
MKHNRGEFEGAADGFLLYTKAGGKVFQGLVNRRKDERAVYLGA